MRKPSQIAQLLAQPDEIAQLLAQLVQTIEDCAFRVPLICSNCSEELILICPECEHYAGDPEGDGCLPAASYASCSMCDRPAGRSHHTCCRLGELLHEARETIRDLEAAE